MRKPLKPLLCDIIKEIYFSKFYLGQIERIELPVFRLLEGHHLDEHGPGREVSGGDGIIEVPDNNNISLITTHPL